MGAWGPIPEGEAAPGEEPGAGLQQQRPGQGQQQHIGQQTQASEDALRALPRFEPSITKPGTPGAAAQQHLQEAGEAAKSALGGFMLVVVAVSALLIVRLAHLLWPFRYAVAVALAAGEVAFFFLWYRRRYTQLNTQPAVHAPAHVDSMRLFNRFVSLCHSLPDGVDIETYLSSWFRWGQGGGCKARLMAPDLY